MRHTRSEIRPCSHLARHRLLVWATSSILFLAGCGDENGPGSGDMVADAGADVASDKLDTNEDLMDECDPQLLDETGMPVTRVQVAAGATTSLTATEALTDVTIADGWSAKLDGDQVVIEAPYEIGSTEMVLTAECSEEPVTYAADVRPLEWQALPSWSPGDTGPVGREYFDFWIDPGSPDTAWVFGGFHYEPVQFTPASDLWRLDLGDDTWTRVEATGEVPASGGASVAVGPDGELLRYGGLTLSNGSYQVPFSLTSLDVANNQAAFAEREPEGVQGGDYQPAFFYDSPRDRYLAVGGQDHVGEFHMDLHAYDAGLDTWSPLSAEGPGPVGRNGFFWVHDASRERLVVFSGETGPQPNGACSCASDTWALELNSDPPRWELLIDDEAFSPPPRRNGSYALDVANNRMFIWGGTANAMDAEEGVFALDLRRGQEAWYRVPTIGNAPVRSSGGMIWDAARDRLVVGFGNTTAGPFVDLWSLSLK